MIERPQQGGSYVRDKQTGKLTRAPAQKPEPKPEPAMSKEPAEPAMPKKPAESKPSVKESGNG